jgi:hypothetical protein
VKFLVLPFALTLLVALTIGPASAEPDSADLVKESVARWGLQTELPDANSGPRIGTPNQNVQPPTEMPDPKSGPRTDMSDPPLPAPHHGSASREVPAFIRVLLWGAVIVGTAVVVWSLRDSLPAFSRSRKTVASAQPPPSEAQSSRMEEARIEADDLARQGHYGEAMHLLLLNSLSEIRRQLGTSFAISLTSREILRRVQLPDIARQSLRAIIAAVERTYFRGDDAGQADYSHCRSHFETLKHALASVAGT